MFRMRPCEAARLLPLALCLTLALSAAAESAGAKTARREEVLRLCREQFGAPVDAARNLFEVNRWHVLEARFDSRGRLSELNVVPKYWFEESHPEWEEPAADGLDGYWARHLTEAESEKLLARLDAVGPKGRLLKRAEFAVVTNLTEPLTDYHERATLTRGKVVDLRRGDAAPPLVRYVRLRYGDGRKLWRQALERGRRFRRQKAPLLFPPEEKPVDKRR
jgi:hypothetical protein